MLLGTPHELATNDQMVPGVRSRVYLPSSQKPKYKKFRPELTQSVCCLSSGVNRTHTYANDARAIRSTDFRLARVCIFDVI